MTTPRPPRRFDDDEVSLIIRRASELQEAQLAPPTEGMTLAELESVAQETGLDPALVRRAAAEVEARVPVVAPSSPSSLFLGGATTLHYERVVDGDLSTDAYEGLVDEIRRALNDLGSVSLLGRTLAWTSTPRFGRRRQQGRRVNVTVAARGGTTTIRVEESLGNFAGGVFGGVMGGVGGGGSGIAVGVGLATFHSGLAAAGIWAGLVGASYALARTIFTTTVRRRSRQLEQLADRLASLAEDAAAQNGRSSSS